MGAFRWEAMGKHQHIQLWTAERVERRRSTSTALDVDGFGRFLRHCVSCGANYGAETDYHFFGVCARCAEAVANLFTRAHSGAWLTWANEPPVPQQYVKDQIPVALRWEVWERDDFRCQECGCRRDLTIDHIKPERRGGKTVAKNLQTLCRSCNSKKGTNG